MNLTRADLARLLARAAELRASGASWNNVAVALGRSAATCRRWPQKYPDLWRQAFATAARERLAEGGAEGLQTLREMLRSKDDKTRETAAKALAGLLARALPADEGDGRRDADPTLTAFIEMTDAELLALLDSVRPFLTSGEAQKTSQ